MITEKVKCLYGVKAKHKTFISSVTITSAGMIKPNKLTFQEANSAPTVFGECARVFTLANDYPIVKSSASKN